MDFQDKKKDFKDYKLFIPGPTYVRPELKVAAAEMPDFGHRDIEIQRRLKPLYANLLKIAGVEDGYYVVLIPGSGSSAMEASIQSLVADDEVVLCVAVGNFGKLYYDMAVTNAKDAELLSFDPGRAIDLDVLEEKLKQMDRDGRKPGVVTFTHNETSTGVMHDAGTVASLIRRYDAMPLVDGVSIYGGGPAGIKEGNVGLYATATQKCLALPAGFGIAIVSSDAIEKIKYLKEEGKIHPSHLLDLSKHLGVAKNFQIMSTPNCFLVNALYLQADYIVNKEGIENRFARHRQMKEMTHKWVEELGEGFSLFTDKEYASDSLSAVELPLGFTTKGLQSVKEDLRQEGYIISPGYPKINQALEAQGKSVTMRISHMGDITPEMIDDYLKALTPHMLKGKKS